MKKLALLGGLVALVTAAPAIAQTTDHHPVKSHKCMVHRAAYTAFGTITAWSATETNDRWSGTVTVNVKRANHHARSDRGNTVTYTLVDARVAFGHGVTNPPVGGERVAVIGKITEATRKCTNATGAGVVSVRKLIVHANTKQ